MDVLMMHPNLLSNLKSQVVDLPSPASSQQQQNEVDALALMAMQESDGD